MACGLCVRTAWVARKQAVPVVYLDSFRNVPASGFALLYRGCLLMLLIGA